MILCHELGIPSRRHLRALITEEEIIEWIIFNKVYPIGQDRLDVLLTNINYNVIKGWAKEPPKYEDIFPKWRNRYRTRSNLTIMAGFANSAAKFKEIK